VEPLCEIRTSAPQSLSGTTEPASDYQLKKERKPKKSPACNALRNNMGRLPNFYIFLSL